MKRVHVKDGLKQRINEVLGTDDPLTNDPHNSSLKNITPWSVQSAMIDNMRRLARSLVGGSSVGRVMQGLGLSQTGAQTYMIGSGIGITNEGDIIVIDASLDITLAGGPADFVEVYLKHTTIEVDGSEVDGRTTNFVGKAGTGELVIDDYAAAQKSGVNTPAHIAQIVIQENDATLSDNDLVYVGRVTVSGGNITALYNSLDNGLSPNTAIGRYRIRSLDVDPGDDSQIVSHIRTDLQQAAGTTVTNNGDHVQNGTLDASSSPEVNLPDGVGELKLDGATPFNGTFQVDNSSGTVEFSLTFINGILTQKVTV